MGKILDYARLVKFPHTFFALPFAMASYVYALTANPIPFDIWLLVKILFCLVFARNAAMAFNRWADRDIDAANPRTGDREIPAGKIKPGAVLAFVVANAILFMGMALWINPLCFYLSPLALFFLLSYSYAKRVTAWSHIVLGICMSIAPAGAYIAVTGSLAIVPMLLSTVVLCWGAGFDIFYAMQDVEFDRANGLKSVPASFSLRTARIISAVLHIIAAYTVILMGMYCVAGTLYWIGAGLFIAILIVEHILFRPEGNPAIGKWFGFINGMASVVYAGCMVADILLRM